GWIPGSASRPRNDGKRGTLFLFDEPTTGLHFDDIAKLLRSFQKLIDAGHSIAVIEHNLDVMRAADWIIDLGPEGGDEGGLIVCEGTPAQVMRHPISHTAKALREYEEAMKAVTPDSIGEKGVTPDLIRGPSSSAQWIPGSATRPRNDGKS